MSHYFITCQNVANYCIIAAMSSKADELLQLARTQVVRSRDLAELHMPRRTLGQLVARGELLRSGRGVYVAADFELTEHHSLVMAAKRWPQSVVCLLSALQFHELTLELPADVWLAFPRGGSLPHASDMLLRTFQMSEETFSEGIETHVIEGVNVRVYSAAKTVADCFKFRSQVGTSVAYEALKNAWTQRKATPSDLVRYAKLCRVHNVMRPYLETLQA